MKNMHKNCLLLLWVAIYLLFVSPLNALAGDCWVGTLKVKKHLKAVHHYQKRNVETYSGSSSQDAWGHVMFYVEGVKLNIISKNISGSSHSTFSRETSCVHYKGTSTGILTEGEMSQKMGGRHTAYWKTNHKTESIVKNIEGCMQDPIPPIEYQDEIEDYAFEGIAHPGMYKLAGLCSSVKNNPELGYCNEFPQRLGYHGRMARSTTDITFGPGERRGGGEPSVEGNEIYEWYVRKVPCQCTAQIVDLKGDVKINGMQLSGEGKINLSDAIVETGRRSSILIKFGSVTVKLAPNSSVDLKDVCQKEPEKPSVLELIKGSIRAKIQKIVGGGGPFIYKGTNAHAGVRGTDFILISGDDKTVVMVLDGEVSFWDINKRKTVTVKKNQKSECEKGGIPTNPVFFNPQEIPEWLI